jgi:hypothetical protein
MSSPCDVLTGLTATEPATSTGYSLIRQAGAISPAIIFFHSHAFGKPGGIVRTCRMAAAPYQILKSSIITLL